MNNNIYAVRRLILYCLTWAFLASPDIAISAPQSADFDNADHWSLNSDGIRAKFGTYGVEVIRQDENVRVSSLYSVESGGRITRTLAVVLFAGEALAVAEDEHKDIVAGASIGSTFRDAGWQIHKANVYLGELRGSGKGTLVDQWLGYARQGIFAIHIYDFFIQKDGRSHKYATIAEIHDPDYLTLPDLQARYSDEASQLQRLNSWNADALRAVLLELDR